MNLYPYGGELPWSSVGGDSAVAFSGKGAVVGVFMFAGAAMKYSMWFLRLFVQ